MGQRPSLQVPWLKATVFAGVLAVSLVVFAAQRKVSIPLDNGSIKLFNGSAVAVTYNLACYGTNGSNAFTSNGLTLAAKTTMKLGGSGSACGDNSAPLYTSFSNGMILCGPYTTRSYAVANVCPSGFHVCTIGEWDANRGGYTTNGWLATTGFDSNWGYSYDSGSSYSNASFASDEYPTSSYSGSYCKTGPGTNSGTVYTHCGMGNANSGQTTLCCPDTGSISACDVEINMTTTPAGGYLQSPQFKGNSPF